MPKKHIRATVLEPGVRELRYTVMKDCISRFNDAILHKYFLEAVALSESLIADRMESRLTELHGKAHHFDTLGNLKKDLSRIEKSPEIKKIINNDLNSWLSQRNIAIHQAAKIEKGKKKIFADHMRESKKTAEVGFKMFRALDKEINKLRREKLKKSKK